MWETLISVVIGGIIASVGAWIIIFQDNRRWRIEKKIEYLRARRKEYQEMYTQTLEKLGTGMQDNFYDSEMSASIFVLMPDEIKAHFTEWIGEKDKTDLKGKITYMNIAVAMKEHLTKIDQQIEKLIGAPKDESAK